jgi:hypothetical protein
MKVDNQGENKFLFSGLFSVTGIELSASGEQILAFEFPTPAEANEQAKLVSDNDYGIGLKYINWIVSPQYFKNGNIIVV